MHFSELLEAKLTDEKIGVWRDVSSLKAGEEWRVSIDAGIRESFALVLALSPSSCSSHYVTYEWANAMGLGKPIIPVLLEESSRYPKIEPIQYIDFRNHNNSTWEQLIQRVKETREDREVLEDERDENAMSPLTPEERKVIEEIQGYLSERGFRMMSFERIRAKINREYNNGLLEELVNKVGWFTPAKLKGRKMGLRWL